MARKSGRDRQPSPPSESAVQQAAKLIRAAQNGLVLTGAGISTPSGIPDFRSTDSGLWTRYDPMTVASLRAFRYAPERFYNWIRPLVDQIFAARPNAAHQALARLESAGHISTIITQNVDDLHQQAGSRRVLEIHGSFRTLTCVQCFLETPVETVAGPFLQDQRIPRCERCGGVLKPNVILFEEELPAHVWLAAERASRTCDLFVVVGSSLEVLPVAGLPMRALERKVPLIVVNLTPTYVDVRADVVIRGDVAQYLPRIAEETLRA